ncbi:uncharacterized protein LOC62_01G000030 [Vanrija pseudolonga]|uniref:Uncharacterized protein n=1 Tax=Vanrija pseudolonga TaxID=143232 RepID=A0AAF1BHW7_9TREE|nr:hypothetical protein LOC62_01G000030 [Vanrija pseudolonga]
MAWPYRHLDPVYSNLTNAQAVLGEGVCVAEWGKAHEWSLPGHVLRVEGMRRMLPKLPRHRRTDGQAMTIPGFLYWLPGAECVHAIANNWPTIIIPMIMLKPDAEAVDDEQLGRLQVIPCGRPFPVRGEADDVWASGSTASSPRYISSRPNSPAFATGALSSSRTSGPAGGGLKLPPLSDALYSLFGTPPPLPASPLPLSNPPTPSAAAGPSTAPVVATPEADRPNKRPRTRSSGRPSAAQEQRDNFERLTAQVRGLEERLVASKANTDAALSSLKEKIEQLMLQQQQWFNYFNNVMQAALSNGADNK